MPPSRPSRDAPTGAGDEPPTPPGTEPPPAGTPDAGEPAGDTAPLGARGLPPDELPPWSRARDVEPPAEPQPAAGDATPAEARASAAAALTPAAVADAWSTHPETAATPRWATARRDRPYLFGDRMAAGVLLTLAAGSMIGGGIAALVGPGSDLDTTVRTVICGAVAVVLLVVSVMLRLVRGSDDVRGTLAVTGIAFAAAALVFAYNPDQADAHATLVTFALTAGLVAVLGWAAAAAVPSAVTGLIGVVALGAAVGAGIWLAMEDPTTIEVFVGTLGVGIAVALVLPRLALLRPHPAGLGWALAGAAVVMTFSAIALMARQDAFTLAAGATASAAMLGVAQRHRNLPAAVGAFLGLAYLEALLISTRTGATSGSFDDTQLIIVVAVGVVLVVLVAIGVVMQRRGRAWPPRRRAMPAGITDLLLLAALALAVISLFTANSNLPLTPQQLTPTQTTTQTIAAAPT